MNSINEHSRLIGMSMSYRGAPYVIESFKELEDIMFVRDSDNNIVELDYVEQVLEEATLYES